MESTQSNKVSTVSQRLILWEELVLSLQER